MFILRYFKLRSIIRTNCFAKDRGSSKIFTLFKRYTGIVCNVQTSQNLRCACNKTDSYKLDHRKYYSKILDGDVTDIQGNQDEKELKKITQLFPQPRVTLNELTSKTPQKIFDVHYKQHTVTGRKRMAQGDWVCTYAFVWPERMKFESTAISKRQAAEKAATQALIWLYRNQRIDNKGSPVYEKEVLNKLRDTIDDHIQINVSTKSIEKIQKVWSEYETGIKPIYASVFKEAAQKAIKTSVLSKDSSLDDDEFSDDELPSNEETDLSDSKSHIHPVYGKTIKQPSESTLLRREKILKERFQQYDEGLTPLPIDGYADQISSTLATSRVTVIVGAAGCGKSTRAPAAILRRGGARTAAVVAEPRRVAAIGLAERVASELGEEVGESVGYQVRLHSKPPRPPGGSILYCTSGVLLRRLQNNPGLEGCTHVIIDEAHERDVNTDITLLLLKRALTINPQLKVVVMSATLDTEVFTRYFDTCPVIEVPGRTFPVEISYLDDIRQKFGLSLRSTVENSTKEDSKPIVYSQEVVEVIKAVDSREPEGAILVFLPGWAEIKATKQLLDECYGRSTMHMILPVHSRLSTSDQTKMFAKPSPGVRKIVLSTNIAETSITIPDVVYVIDSGAHKENRIREGTGTATLETVWVSQAAAKQRTGRAGRVQAGHCYRLYTKEKESQFVPHTTPEILRIPLEQTVLDCKTYAPGDKVENFLAQLPEPPSKEAVQFAVDDLVDLGALTPSEDLTRLGSILTTMSLHPRLACGMLQSAVAGCVLSFAVTAALCADNVEVFRDAADRRDEIRELKSNYSKTSDHSAFYRIQMEFEEAARGKKWRDVDQWCERYGLRKDRLAFVKSLSNLYLEQLLKSGFIEANPKSGFIEANPDPEDLTRFSDIEELSAAMLVAGVNSLLTTRRHVKTKGKLNTVTELFTSKGERAHIGSESVNYAIAKRRIKPALLSYFGGRHSIERRALVLHKTTVVPPHTALIFCRGDAHKVEDNDSETTIISLPKHNLKIQVPASQASAILKAREMWWQTFQFHVDRDFQTLEYEDHVTTTAFRTKLVETLARILVEGHSEFVLGKTRIEKVDEY